jgi:hypothetical protein
MEMQKLCCVIATALLLLGCRHAPLSYQLTRQGTMPVLVPPASSVVGSATVTEIQIKNARHRALHGGDCDIEDALIALHWDGKTANVRLKSAAYRLSEANQATLGDKPLPGMYLASVQSLDASRDDLIDLGSKRCLTSKGDYYLRLAIVERFPLPPDIAYLFRFGGYALTGVLDLNSDFRLQVIGPVQATGAPASTKQPIGHETANYIFASEPKDDRVRISLAKVSETDVGQTTSFQKSAPQNAFPFPASFGYFRLLFRTEASSANHIATIISAPDKARLNEATKERETGPADSCHGVSVAGATCIVFPPDFGVNGEMRIQVNGHEDFVRVEANLGELMHSTRAGAVPKTLMIRRVFQGRVIPVRFDYTNQDILGLVLMPGDEISW